MHKSRYLNELVPGVGPLEHGIAGGRGRGRRRQPAVERRILRGRREAHGRARGRVAHVPARGAAARPLAPHSR